MWNADIEKCNSGQVYQLLVCLKTVVPRNFGPASVVGLNLVCETPHRCGLHSNFHCWEDPSKKLSCLCQWRSLGVGSCFFIVSARGVIALFGVFTTVCRPSDELQL